MIPKRHAASRAGSRHARGDRAQSSSSRTSRSSSTPTSKPSGHRSPRRGSARQRLRDDPGAARPTSTSSSASTSTVRSAPPSPGEHLVVRRGPRGRRAPAPRRPGRRGRRTAGGHAAPLGEHLERPPVDRGAHRAARRRAAPRPPRRRAPRAATVAAEAGMPRAAGSHAAIAATEREREQRRSPVGAEQAHRGHVAVLLVRETGVDVLGLVEHRHERHHEPRAVQGAARGRGRSRAPRVLGEDRGERRVGAAVVVGEAGSGTVTPAKRRSCVPGLGVLAHGREPRAYDLSRRARAAAVRLRAGRRGCR